MKNLKQQLTDSFQALMKISLTNRRIVYLLDLTICLISFIVAVGIQINTTSDNKTYDDYIITGFIYLIYNAIFFYLLKSFSGLIRHSNIREIWRPFLALVISVILFLLTLILMGYHKGYSTFFSFNIFLISFFMVIIFRVSTVYIYNMTKSYTSHLKKKAFIFEIAPRSVALANWINRSSHSTINIVGFITREYSSAKSKILEKGIYFINEDFFSDLVHKHDVSTILFSDYKQVRKEQDFVTFCAKLGLSVLVAPPLEGLDNNSNNNFKIKPIQLEDLLGRDEIKIDLERISEKTKGKVVLITGAAGSIGSELVRQISRFNPANVILFDNAETPLHNIRIELETRFPELVFIPVIGDVRNLNRVEWVFKKFKPEIVYHAAAYKHVPLMEENPCEAVRVNVGGTRNVINCTIKYNSESFVMISTDKAVKPTNIMGATKRVAEIYVQSLAKQIQSKGNQIRIITTRFGNVLGSNGSVIPRFREQIEKGGPVTVTDPNIIRYFMTIPEACRLVLEAASFGNNGEIYVFDMGSPVKIAELAKRMIELSGYKPDEDIKIIYTGLRPGEKLYEELLNDKETTLPTLHDKITIAKVDLHDFEIVKTSIEKIILSAEENDVENTVLEMKALMKDFKSQNSPFQKFDIAFAEK